VANIENSEGITPHPARCATFSSRRRLRSGARRHLLLEEKAKELGKALYSPQ
jgi:hypothetical protein